MVLLLEDAAGYIDYLPFLAQVLQGLEEDLVLHADVVPQPFFGELDFDIGIPADSTCACTGHVQH